MTQRKSRLYAHDNTTYTKKSVVVSYDAIDSVIARLSRAGRLTGHVYCAVIGKYARIDYWQANK